MGNQITIQMIISLTSIMATILVAYITFLNSKKIKKIEAHQKKDYDRFKQFLLHNNKRKDEYLFHLKNFLQLSQELKDNTRELLKNKNYIVQEELQERILLMKQELISRFSESVFVFNNSDKEGYAHTIKILFIEIFDDILDNKFNVNNQINLISNKQKELQEEVNKEVDKIMNKIYS